MDIPLSRKPKGGKPAKTNSTQNQRSQVQPAPFVESEDEEIDKELTPKRPARISKKNIESNKFFSFQLFLKIFNKCNFFLYVSLVFC